MMTKRHAATPANLDELDRAIINRLQDGFPLTASPFAHVAREISEQTGECCTQDALIGRTQRLRDDGIITRFGPFLDAAAMGGAFCLCAMEVPQARFDEVADTVNRFCEVAHNYEREHRLNMWFVLATETPQAIEAAATRIEAATGLAVLRFPKLEEYFIGFKVAA